MSGLTTVTIHGIGSHTPDYNLRWNVAEALGVSADQVLSFYYEDILDRSTIGVWTQLAAQAGARWLGPKVEPHLSKPADALADVFAYFLSRKTRQRIDRQLLAMLQPKAQIRLIGHSLGSIVAYCFLRHYPDLAERTQLVSLGSPIGSPVVGALVRRWLPGLVEGTEPIRVLDWVNVSSELDPLSGPIGWPEDPVNRVIPVWDGVRHQQVFGYLKFYAQHLRHNGSIVA